MPLRLGKDYSKKKVVPLKKPNPSSLLGLGYAEGYLDNYGKWWSNHHLLEFGEPPPKMLSLKTFYKGASSINIHKVLDRNYPIELVSDVYLHDYEVYLYPSLEQAMMDMLTVGRVKGPVHVNYDYVSYFMYKYNDLHYFTDNEVVMIKSGDRLVGFIMCIISGS